MEGLGLIGNILLGVSAILIVSLGVLVLMQNKNGIINHRFFVLTIATALWCILNLLFFTLGPDLRYALGLLSYGSAVFLAVSFLLFCNSLSGLNLSTPYENSLILFGFIFGVISVLPGAIATDVSDKFEIITNEQVLAVYGLVLLFYFVAGLVSLLWGSFKAKHTRDKSAIVIILLGMFASACIGISFNLVLPLMGNYHFVQYGPVGALAFVAASTYAIIRHRLFDVRLAAVRTVAYVLSLATMSGVYFLLAYVVSRIFFQENVTQGVSVSPVNIALALVLAFIFQPVKQFFDRVTNVVFYRDRYNSDDFIKQIGKIVTSTIQLRQVLNQSGALIKNTLKADDFLFLIYRKNSENILVGNKKYANFDEDDSKLVRRLAEDYGHHVLVVSGETHAVESEKQLQRALSKKRISLVLPLIAGEETLGYLFLGEQMGSDYTRRDISVLETISNELVIAVQNARSVQVVRDLNANLEDRIDDAIKELKQSNKRLQRLDATKDEFISMASHQLRTPLTSIKGYISMLLDGDAGEISKDQRRLLSEAFYSSERMVRLIGDFLNVSRLQTGKFVIDKRKLNIGEMVEQEVQSLSTIAVTHDMELKPKIKGPIPELYIDEAKLRQVVMNFIDNAIYYSHPGSDIKVNLYVDGGYLIFEVIDKGIGVPKNEQKHLFTRFFRAENARRQRPDGTGVGIYLAKRVVTEHGGSIIFNSIENKGSTFGFRLPIKKLSLEDNADNSSHQEGDKGHDS